MTIHVSETGISPYAICIVLSYVIGYTYTFVQMRRDNVPKSIYFYTLMLTGFCSVYLAVIYTRCTSGAFGISSMGAMFGMILGIVIMTYIARDYKHSIMTAYITALPLFYSISKIGCFLVGCCNGKLYSGPFYVEYFGTPSHIQPGRLFPIQLLETMVFFLIFCFSYFYRKKRGSNCVTIILCGVSKFLLDYLRMSHANQIFSVNQIFCILTIIITLVIALGKHTYSKDLTNGYKKSS